MKRVLDAWSNKKWETVRGELREVMKGALRKRDDRIGEEVRERLKVVEDKEGRIRDMVGRELEEVLERRENRSREVEREYVRTMLRERSKEWDRTKDLEGQGKQALCSEKEVILQIFLCNRNRMY